MSYAFPLLTSALFSPCWLLLGERVCEWMSKSLFGLESVDEWRGKGGVLTWVCDWLLTEVLVCAWLFVWLLDLLTESKFWYLWYRQINFVCLVSLFLVLHLTATVLALSLCQACNFIVLWVNKQKCETVLHAVFQRLHGSNTAEAFVCFGGREIKGLGEIWCTLISLM